MVDCTPLTPTYIYTNVLVQVRPKTTGLTKLLPMTLSVPDGDPISGRSVAFIVKPRVGSKMDIEGLRYIDNSDKQKHLRSRTSEMETVFMMERICSLAYGNVTEIAHEIYDPKTSLPDLSLKDSLLIC